MALAGRSFQTEDGGSSVTPLLLDRSGDVVGQPMRGLRVGYLVSVQVRKTYDVVELDEDYFEQAGQLLCSPHHLSGRSRMGPNADSTRRSG